MTSPLTFEGIVENGQIKLAANVHLPDQTKVYVIVPDFENTQSPRIFSPRLVHPEQAKDFEKEVTEVPSDAEL